MPVPVPVPIGEVVYDNTRGFLGTFASERREYGDTLHLSGHARIVKEFAFEYYADFTAQGDETARIRFYVNEHPHDPWRKSPGTVLYDSGNFAIAKGYASRVLTNLSVGVPDIFTFTIEFNGLAPEEKAGLLLYWPFRTGFSFNEFWGRSAQGGWEPFLYSRTDLSFKANAGVLVRAEYEPPPVSIQNVSRQTGAAVVTANAVYGKTYALESRDSLGGDSSWKPVSGSAVQATGPTVTLRDPSAAPTAQRFYRVVTDPPPPLITSVTRDAGTMLVKATVAPGRGYTLEYREGLQAGTAWRSLGLPPVTALQKELVLPDVSPQNASRFYRVVEHSDTLPVSSY